MAYSIRTTPGWVNDVLSFIFGSLSFKDLKWLMISPTQFALLVSVVSPGANARMAEAHVSQYFFLVSVCKTKRKRKQIENKTFRIPACIQILEKKKLCVYQDNLFMTNHLVDCLGVIGNASPRASQRWALPYNGSSTIQIFPFGSLFRRKLRARKKICSIFLKKICEIARIFGCWFNGNI